MANIPPKPTAPAKPAGRAVEDERRQSKCDWLSVTGTFRPDLDTERLKALGADLSGEDLTKLEARASNPYNKASVRKAGSATGVKRRSLDDMRRLNEEIKAKQRTGQLGPTACDTSDE